jgi:hypothetical protein
MVDGQVGSLGGKLDGRWVGWQVGRLAGWQVGRLAGWQVGGLAGWQVGSRQADIV